MLMDPGLESKVRLVSAITTLLQNAPELGNSQLKVVSVFKFDCLLIWKKRLAQFFYLGQTFKDVHNQGYSARKVISEVYASFVLQCIVSGR